MATTTNFGWETPDDTDLVKDGAAAIRTALGGVDTSFVDLKGGTTGQVLSKASNTDLDFSWVAQDDSNAIQNALLTTTGDTIYASGASTPARLGIGTTGQVLTVSGGVPTWATPSGGGKVLQVVSDVGSTATTSSTNTYIDISGFSVSITPSATSSKIMVLVSLDWRKTNANADAAGDFILVRNGTTILTSNDFTLTEAAEYATACWSINYLDSPSSTSALTYKVQFRSRNNNAAIQAVFLGASSQANITVMEIGA